jgi:sugar fermentation stimulation protein A
MRLPPLTKGTLIRRYKRFLADVRLENGDIITAHCPNSGSMRSCNMPGSWVLLSFNPKPERKYAYTWELIKAGEVWIGINTQHPNKLVHEAITHQRIAELAGYNRVKREVKYGKNSRIDLLLGKEDKLCYVEVKNVTLVEDEIALFPDAITERGTKHLNELMQVVNEGSHAVMFFVVQRQDASLFRPARHIDPLYSATLRQAFESGVEILVYQAMVTPTEIVLNKKLEFEL